MSENIARRDEIVSAAMDDTDYYPQEYLRMKDLAIRTYNAAIQSERAKAEKLLKWLELMACEPAFNCAVGEGNLRAAAKKAIAEYEDTK
jgi:hypothetical protein